MILVWVKGDPHVKTYLDELNSPPLDVKVERELVRNYIENGCLLSRDKVMESNLKFVAWQAAKYTGKGLPFSDLIQEGNLGLIEALNNYDYNGSYSFRTYAWFWVKQHIMQSFITHGRTVRLPLHQYELCTKIVKYLDNIENTVTTQDIAHAINATEHDIKLCLGFIGRPQELDSPVDGEDGDTLRDLIPDNEPKDGQYKLEKEDLIRSVHKVLNTLSPQERDVILKFYGIGCEKRTLQRIGDDLGFHPERARQLRDKALRKLRHHDRATVLKQFI